MLHPESVEINKRFFLAIDELIGRKRLRGRKTFATRYGLNWGNFYKLRKNPDHSLELAYLKWIVQDFGISSQWLLTGEGEMFSKRFQSETAKPVQS